MPGQMPPRSSSRSPPAIGLADSHSNRSPPELTTPHQSTDAIHSQTPPQQAHCHNNNNDDNKNSSGTIDDNTAGPSLPTFIPSQSESGLLNQRASDSQTNDECHHHKDDSHQNCKHRVECGTRKDLQTEEQETSGGITLERCRAPLALLQMNRERLTELEEKSGDPTATSTAVFANPLIKDKKRGADDERNNEEADQCRSVHTHHGQAVKSPTKAFHITSLFRSGRGETSAAIVDVVGVEDAGGSGGDPRSGSGATASCSLKSECTEGNQKTTERSLTETLDDNMEALVHDSDGSADTDEDSILRYSRPVSSRDAWGSGAASPFAFTSGEAENNEISFVDNAHPHEIGSKTQQSEMQHVLAPLDRNPGLAALFACEREGGPQHGVALLAAAAAAADNGDGASPSIMLSTPENTTESRCHPPFASGINRGLVNPIPVFSPPHARRTKEKRRDGGKVALKVTVRDYYTGHDTNPLATTRLQNRPPAVHDDKKEKNSEDAVVWRGGSPKPNLIHVHLHSSTPWSVISRAVARTCYLLFSLTQWVLQLLLCTTLALLLCGVAIAATDTAMVAIAIASENQARERGTASTFHA